MGILIEENPQIYSNSYRYHNKKLIIFTRSQGEKVLNNKDFTLRKYETLCEAISNSRYTNVTIREYLENSIRLESVILIRHDVDENVRFALDMAKVEADYGLKSTYYFRTKKKVYVPSIIDKIKSYHHEIGYHYETLDIAKGDMDLAIHLFSSELSKFREKYDVKTVCMHGNPLTKFDNRDIWKKCSLSDFDLIGEPYLSIDYNQFAYFSDSGRTWDLNKNKVKDTINKSTSYCHVNTTDDLIRQINLGNLNDICILTHPSRWSKNVVDYYYRYSVDLLYNIGKWILIRKSRQKNRNGGSR